MKTVMFSNPICIFALYFEYLWGCLFLLVVLGGKQISMRKTNFEVQRLLRSEKEFCRSYVVVKQTNSCFHYHVGLCSTVTASNKVNLGHPHTHTKTCTKETQSPVVWVPRPLCPCLPWWAEWPAGVRCAWFENLFPLQQWECRLTGTELAWSPAASPAKVIATHDPTKFLSEGIIATDIITLTMSWTRAATHILQLDQWIQQLTEISCWEHIRSNTIKNSSAANFYNSYTWSLNTSNEVPSREMTVTQQLIMLRRTKSDPLCTNSINTDLRVLATNPQNVNFKPGQ